MRLIQHKDGDRLTLTPPGARPERVHVFAQDDIDALNAALAAERPLLLRGEPGVGKSQLALAAAISLERAYLQHVVDARTEARDLLYRFDAVARLADAQLVGALGRARPEAAKATRQALEVERYLQPAVLWWALNWQDAQGQAATAKLAPPRTHPPMDPANGTVILIDEIDKAEADVPNGLLEALGDRSFQPQGHGRRVTAGGEPPLVVITTNEERALPDAFVRRCLVHEMRLPQEEGELIERLTERGQAHFANAHPATLSKAGQLLWSDREQARKQHWFPLPGQAEYLDLVRAVLALDEGQPEAQRDRLVAIAPFFLKKHQGARM